MPHFQVKFPGGLVRKRFGMLQALKPLNCELCAKTGGFDHSSPEIIKLSKKLANNHLTIKLGGKNIPADTGHYHRFFQSITTSCNLVRSGDLNLFCFFSYIQLFLSISVITIYFQFILGISL